MLVNIPASALALILGGGGNEFSLSQEGRQGFPDQVGPVVDVFGVVALFFAIPLGGITTVAPRSASAPNVLLCNAVSANRGSKVKVPAQLCYCFALVTLA